MVKELGKKPRTGAVDRVATRHAKRYRPVAWTLAEKFNAVVVGRGGGLEIAVRKERAKVFDGVNFDGKALGQPFLDQRILDGDRPGHDRDRRAPLDLLQP